MKLSEILVFICLLEGAKQFTAGHGPIPSTETLRDLIFECEDGWGIYKANCYKYEEYPLNLEEASYACMRQGGWLYYSENELEYFEFVSHHWPKKIWFGYVQWKDDSPTLSDTGFSLEFLPGWGLNQPDHSAGVGIAVSHEEMLTIVDSNQTLPFVCKHRACLQGYRSCDLASKCIKNSQICDGNPDCQDKSDENNCAQYGTTYTKTSETTGSVDIDIVSSDTDRTWTIEVPIGSRIRFFIPSFNLQKNIGFLELLSGSPTPQYAEVLERITGSNTGHYLYSINNFVILRFYSQGLSATSSSIRITWTTDIAGIPSTPTLLEASNSLQSLIIPFSSDENQPAYLVLNWVITAEEGKYITYYLEISPLTGYGIEAVRYEIYVGGRSIEHRNYYVSSTNEVAVRSQFVPENGEATLKYRIGCGMDISEPYGYVHSPRPLIPNNLNCTWNFDGGIQAGRGMTFKFTELDLTPDPRTQTTVMSADKFSINLYDGNNPIVNVTLYDSVDDIIAALSGKASVQFVSDVVLQSGPFEFMFGTDCESLDLSEETIMSTDVSYLKETVELSCPEGYKFNMEKYPSNSVNVVCRPDGWSFEDDESVCIPECQIVFCGTPMKIANGGVVGTTGVTFGSEATYTCNPGFAMEGDENATCGENGEWNETPVCSSSSCDALESNFLADGMFEIVAGNDFTETADFDTVVKFSCNEGYELVGPVISHCDENGWTHKDNSPTCERLVCPVYPVPHSNMMEASVNSPVPFEGNVDVECSVGYRFTNGVEGILSITCQANQTFDQQLVCEDFDECDESPSPCNNDSTRCVNFDGSYTCECLEGFEPDDEISCQDIDECNDENGGCEDQCSNDPFPYECSCDTPGYVLYKDNGFQGFSLPSSETGYKRGDTYHINHTCIPLLCPPLVSVDHGKYLKEDLKNSHVNEAVTLQCDDGYHVSEMASDVTSVDVECNTTGNWNQLYSCIARTCTLANRTDVAVGTSVELPCTLSYQRSVTYSATCVYENGGMTFVGENIDVCPEIDCGDPEESPTWPDGGTFDGDGPSSTTYNESGSIFVFTCKPGFDRSGLSGDSNSNSTVTCTADGHWSMGTLSCIGKRCTDPGTPGDAEQVADKYEVDSVLYYTCTRAGFMISGPANYTCDYDEDSNTVSWSDNLESNLPECDDDEPPELLSEDCGETLTYEQMDQLDFDIPSSSDNFAVVNWSTNDHVEPGFHITSNFSVTYTATDFMDNEDTCTIDFVVIDRAIKPELFCPDVETVGVSNTSASSINVTEYISVSGGEVQVSPPTINYNNDDIGSAVTVDVTASNGHGTTSSCSFMVNFVAAVCFEQELFIDENADRICVDSNGGGIKCESICHTGYIYSDGAQTKNFTCAGSGSWETNGIPHDRYCLEVEYPIYEVFVEVIYKYEAFTINCDDQYKSAIESNFINFMNRVSEICDGMSWNVGLRLAEGGPSVTEFTSSLTLTLLNIGNSGISPVECLDEIKNVTNAVFDLPDNQLKCGVSSQSIDVTEVTTEEPTLTCDNPAFYEITRNADDEKICVSFGPGEYYDVGTDNFMICPEGEYQDELAQTNCKICTGTEYPNADRTGCLETCPPGFISENGFYPCTPCSENQFWQNKAACGDCLSSWSTVGIEAVESEEGCYAPCPIGTYSNSGFNNTICTSCPVNFYQNVIAQTKCERCADTKQSQSSGSISPNNCTDIVDDCNRTFCSDHGNCSLVYNKRACDCDEGYHGSTCQDANHICDGNPCKNRGTCIKGSGIRDYTCECSTEYDECSMIVINGTHVGTQNAKRIDFETVVNQEECDNLCLNNPDCVEASFVNIGSSIGCILYNDTLTEAELDLLEDGTSGKHSVQMCVEGFDGVDCEQDIKNECGTAGCNEDSECKDKINDFECICPSSGGYSGFLCGATSDPCSPNPCSNGECTSYGAVSYTCECDEGYIGYNCDIDEDYCELHPYICAYGGTCDDNPPGSSSPYSCDCPNGFHGNNCEIAPDFCENHECDGDNVCYSSLDEMDGVCTCNEKYFQPVFKCEMNLVPNETSLNEQDVIDSKTDKSVTLNQCEDLCQYNTDCAVAVFLSTDSLTGCFLYNDSYSGTPGNFRTAIHKNCTNQRSRAYSCERIGEPCVIEGVNCNNGTCRNIDNDLSYVCDCEDGFTGAMCQHNIDDCLNNPCLKGGACTDQHLYFTCNCTVGFEGETCEVDKDFCPGDCTQNGTCYEMENGYECRCNQGFTGEMCETELDECASFPCQHDGECKDTVNDYTCTCPAGWYGNDCEIMEDRCGSIDCANGGQCFNLPENAFCRCEGGALGEFCQNATQMCTIMSNIDPCINGGMCENSAGTAECICPINHNPKRCYFDAGSEGYSGGFDTRYNLIKGRDMPLKECLDMCMEDEECGAMAFSSIDASGDNTLCLFYESGSAELTDDASSTLFIRTCPVDYVGPSCELVKDWCSDNPCENDGRCECTEPTGYRCFCEPGYSGVNCQLVEDPCSSNPCKGIATCRSTPTDYICQCNACETWTGNSCKETNPDYSLLVNSYNNEDSPSLIEPYVLDTNGISVFMRLRIHSFNPDNMLRTLFTLLVTPDFRPYFNEGENDFYVAINDIGIFVLFDDDIVGQIDFDDNFGGQIDDGEWHTLGVSITPDGILSATVDAISFQDSVDLERTLNLTGHSAQHYLAFGYIAELRDVIVWNQVVPASEFVLATSGDHTFMEAPVQCWSNYVLTPASKVVIENDLSKIQGDWSLISPQLNCSAVDDINYVLAERITSLADITGFAQTLEELKNDADVDWTIEHTLPEALKNAYYPIVITATDSNMQYGECRGNLYVRYNEECPDVDVDESVNATSCSNGQGFCNVKCNDLDLDLPAPLPDYIQCGSLGVWDVRLPFSTLALPSCVASQPASYRVTVTMQYGLLISCPDVFTTTTLVSLENQINDQFSELNDLWNNICDWNGQVCGNLDLGGTACVSNTKMFNLILSLSFASMEISAVPGGSMSITEALEIIMLLEQNVDISNFGQATPLPESFSIATMGTCPAGMYLSDDMCAPCSAGWFLNGESGMCNPCDYGEYQSVEGQTMCEKCDDDFTTYITGATSDTDCKVKCLKGTKYDKDLDECVVCPRHYYQAKDGKHFCYPCDVGFKTVLNGSDSEQDCKADCSAGEERDPDSGDCVPCLRGYWRSLIFDDCKQCPDSRTTSEGALGVSEDSCSMDICARGQLYNVLSMQCEDCDIGFFQDELYQLKCKPCSGNRTTQTERTINETECLFYCTSGYELGEALETCEPCERGSFKDNTDDKFGDCELCEQGFTTNKMAAISVANCSIPMCGQGEVILENECEKCAMDSFSDVMSPYLSTECMLCDENYGTQQTGSNSSQCQRYCNAGSYLFEDDCKLCARGSYKDVAGRFSDCVLCTSGMTTEEEGSTDENDCSIPKCLAGSVIVDGSCSECPIDTYSDVVEPNSEIECIHCNEDICDVCMSYGTENVGTNNASLCLPTCPGGSYYSVGSHSCELCQVGKYKPESERFNTDCVECNEGFVTEEEGATSDDQCTLRDCQIGYKITGDNLDECMVCPRGTFQNETRQDFCYSCGTNLNTEGDGKTSSDDCQISCAPGLHGTEVCVPCEDGYIKSVEGFAECAKCPIDTTSNVDHTVCDVVYCNFGKEYDPDNDECLPCELGFFKNTLGNDEECVECEAGTTTNGTGQATCTEPYCVPGKYLNNNECVPCLNGTYKDAAGNDACTDCDAGFTTAEMGSESSTDCAIVVCPAGQYRDPSQTSLCTECEVNFYQSEAGKTSCEPCNEEKITMDKGQTSVDACVPECKAGERFNDTTKTCELCRPGTYKPTVGNTVDCTECAADKTTVGPGKTEEADCSQDLCNPGTHYVVQDNKVSCDPCERGTYTDETNKATCTECPDGKTTRYIASSSADDCIDDCLIGSGYSTVSGECIKCPTRQFNDKKGTNPTVCKRCPKGTSNTVSGSSSCDFVDGTPVVDNAVDVFISLEFDIQIDNCDAGSAIDINIASIDNMIQQLFIDMMSVRFNGPLKFCTSECENMVSTLNGCDLNEQTSHSITLDVLFKQISDFVTDTSDANLEISTLDVITEIVILNIGALSDPGKGITFVKFLEAKYFDVCEPGEKRVNDTCVACEAGYYGEDSITCARCPLDTYQNLERQISCETCPDNTYTELDASTSPEDCIEICEAGTYFESGTCVACPVGEYKTESGNEEDCVSCPSGKTTMTTGATSQDDCSESVCEVGQYFERDNNDVVQCTDCPVGTFSDVIMVEQCKACDEGTTTVLTKSRKKNQCVVFCELGEGIIFPAKICEQCKVGYYNDKQGGNPNMCKRCADGFYTQQSGQSTCSQVPSGTAAPIKYISIVIKVTYRVAIDSCSDDTTLSIIRSSVSIRIRTLLTNRSVNKFSGGRSFCENECINVFISFSIDTNFSKCKARSSNRRKRALTHEVVLDVKLDNVPETVSDGNDVLPTKEVVSQILSTDDLSVDDNIVYEKSEAPEVFPVCGIGQQVSPVDSETCAPCPAGYYSEDVSNCKSCPADTYQNETGQMACKECPTLTFNDDLASHSIGACRGYCDYKPQYCNSRGSCSETGRRSASCACDEGFEGSKCETRSEPTSSLDAILGAAIGGGGALLIIILIVIACWRYMSGQDSKKSKRHMNDPEYTYDNAGLYAAQPPYAPYRSVGHPALGYHPEASFEAGSQLDPYRNERPSMHGDEQDDQPQFVWRA